MNQPSPASASSAPAPAADVPEAAPAPADAAVPAVLVLEDSAPVASPRWSSNTKLIVGLTLGGVIMTLLVYFRSIIGPLLLAFVLSFLIQPLALMLTDRARLSWRASVNLIFLVLVVVLSGMLTGAGFAILQQAQVALAYVQDFITRLPVIMADLSRQNFSLGPFALDLSSLDVQAGVEQALGIVRPLVGEAGTLLAVLASGTIEALGWSLFILLVSYFLLSEAGQWRGELVHIDIPGYTDDIKRLVDELIRTWRAFLRGQMIIAVLIMIAYYIMLNLLGTRLSMLIAIMSGLAAFVPYVGPFVTWTVAGIIAYLQVGNYLGLSPFAYASLVIVLCIFLNQTFDNLIIPRIMGDTLGVHPAGVLIAAIVATDLLGFVGLVLAAPVLATVTVLGRYVARKMLDMDPWSSMLPGRKDNFTPRRLEAVRRWLLARFRK